MICVNNLTRRQSANCCYGPHLCLDKVDVDISDVMMRNLLKGPLMYWWCTINI